jgi:hypothetical protein
VRPSAFVGDILLIKHLELNEVYAERRDLAFIERRRADSIVFPISEGND